LSLLLSSQDDRRRIDGHVFSPNRDVFFSNPGILDSNNECKDNIMSHYIDFRFGKQIARTH